MKKILAMLTAILMCGTLFCGCAHNNGNTTGGVGGGSDGEIEDGEKDPPVTDWFDAVSAGTKQLLSADGYVKDNISDFSQYVGTDAYRTVATADELIEAIVDAKCHYVNNWDEDTKTYTQTPAEGYTEETSWGTVRVIEITEDINLGYYKLSAEAKNSGIVVDFGANIPKWTDYLSMSDMVMENGISQIKVENTSNLLIFSKNGAKITHAGFKLTSDDNVVFRNLQFDELWQWEDAPTSATSKIGDYDWFGWAYFKIAFCGYIWIDHCTFGKSYDGQIDYSNPVYDANGGTAFRAPYGATGPNGLHISWCRFNAGSDDKDGYIYKMMEAIEQNFQDGGTDYLYYNALRNGGASFEDILYGIAIPQKKGFLCGDDAKYPADDYTFNLSLNVSFANCVFVNLEDRLPKLRGGNAYMYNCVVDCSQYYVYRTKLRGIGAAGKVSAVSSTWKCGLVSQGIVCGNGGSVKAENCIYRGIESLLKNNDKTNSGVYVQGGYQIVNCSYQLSENSAVSTTTFPNSTPSTLKSDNFKWNTEDGSQPFAVNKVELEELEEMLSDKNYGAGISSQMQDRLLQSRY